MPDFQTIDVNCNHCGATLQVNENTRFVTCGSCKSRLAVRHSSAATFTEVLEKNSATAETVSEPSRPDLAQMPTPARPFAKRPVAVGRKPSVTAGLLSILFGILAGGTMIVISMHGAPWFFALIGLLFFGGGVYNGFKAISLAMKQ